MPVLGDALVAVTIAALVAALWVVTRRPFLGIGFLVAGLAFHNFFLMTLIRLGTNHVLIRVFQGWKEIMLAVLVAIALWRVYQAYREHRLGEPMPLDWLAAAFLLVMVIYLVLPSSVLHGSTNLQQRLAAFRIAAYIPVLYALGRTIKPADRKDISRVAWLMLGSAAIVGLFGLYELWLVPTRAWLDWGVTDFSVWLGFQYQGPGRLPENFFQSLPSGLYLRRMVSTYVSPLGIAYTGLLVFPVAVVFIDRQRRRTVGIWLAGIALALLLAGVLFSVTRLALLALAGEAVLLALIMRRRWVIALAPAVIVAIFGVLTIYPEVGPAVDANLVGRGAHRGSILTAGDPSFAEHLRTLGADVRVWSRHPFGLGLGSAGSSANRFGGEDVTQNPDYAPGESAILTMFVDTGIVGGVAYLALYLFGIYVAARGLRRTLGTVEAALPMAAVVGGLALLPITLTNDVWGDLSVLFLFWWTVGRGATLAVASEVAVENEDAAVPRRSVASI